MISRILVFCIGSIFVVRSLVKECEEIEPDEDGCHLCYGNVKVCGVTEQINEMCCEMGITSSLSDHTFNNNRRRLLSTKTQKRTVISECPIFNVGDCPAPEYVSDHCTVGAELSNLPDCGRTGNSNNIGSCDDLNDLSAFLCYLNNDIFAQDDDQSSTACMCLETVDGNQICANAFPCEVIELFGMTCDSDQDCEQFQFLGTNWGCVDECTEEFGPCVPENEQKGVCLPECFFSEPRDTVLLKDKDVSSTSMKNGATHAVYHINMADSDSDSDKDSEKSIQINVNMDDSRDDSH